MDHLDLYLVSIDYEMLLMDGFNSSFACKTSLMASLIKIRVYPEAIECTVAMCLIYVVLDEVMRKFSLSIIF